MDQSSNNLFARSLFSLTEVLKTSSKGSISVPQVSAEADRISVLENFVLRAGVIDDYKNYLRSELVESAGPSGFSFREATIEDRCHAAMRAADSFWIEKRLAEKYGQKN